MARRDSWAPDRRRADRRRVPFGLLARLDDGSMWRVVEAGSLGIVVEVDGPLTPDAPLTFALETGDATVGPITGHVAHCRLLLGATRASRPTYLAGVTFDRLPDEARVLLTSLLHREPS